MIKDIFPREIVQIVARLVVFLVLVRLLVLVIQDIFFLRLRIVVALKVFRHTAMHVFFRELAQHRDLGNRLIHTPHALLAHRLIIALGRHGWRHKEGNLASNPVIEHHLGARIEIGLATTEQLAHTRRQLRQKVISIAPRLEVVRALDVLGLDTTQHRGNMLTG